MRRCRKATPNFLARANAMSHEEAYTAHRADPLTRLAFSMYGSPGVYARLVGSGLSRGAEIPTGWEVTLDLIRRQALAQGESDQPDWATWYWKKFAMEPNYSDLVADLGSSPLERRAILHGYIEPTNEDLEEGRKVPTRAHLAIADLVYHGYVRVILTTNFDRLLENALRERGVEPTVIDSVDASKGAEPPAHTTCYLFKLHGDYKDARILNTHAELSQYPPEYDALLDRILDEHGLVVCGWSGEWDEALRRAIMRSPSRRYSLFWATRGPLGDAGKAIVAHRRGHVVPIGDADDFLGRLRDQVQTLARTHRQDPRSVDLLVNSTKRFASRPEHTIELHDLLESEVERLLHGLETSTPQAAHNSDGVQLLCAFYESATEPLARMFGVLGRSGRGTEHDIVANTVLALWAQAGTGGSRLSHLRYYPAVLLLWSYGTGLTLAKRWSAVHELLSHPAASDYGDPKRVVDLLAQWFLEGYRNEIWKCLPELKNHQAPASDHLFDVVDAWRDSFAAVLADFDGSTKIRGVKRRDRLPSEGRASVRGRRLDVQPSMSATLTPRILVLPGLADAGYCNEPDLLELENRGIDAHVALGREGKSRVAIDPDRLPATHRMGEKLAGVAGRPGTRNANGSRRRRTGGSRRCSDSDDPACGAWRRCAASGTWCAWR